MMYALRPLAVASALMLAACGELATGGYRPPYITIEGTISGSTTAAPESVRIALLWQNAQNPGANYAAQTVDVVPGFPATFKLPVRDRPKAGAIHTLQTDTAALLGLDPDLRWGIATLIVFADANSNGAFDMVSPGETSPDRVLAVTTDLDILYLASGEPAPVDLMGLFPTQPGFSLVREPHRRDPLPGECGRFTPQGHLTELCDAKEEGSPTLVDAATTIELALADDRSLERFDCNTFWGAFEYPDWSLASATEVCDGGVCPFCRGYQCPLDLPPPGTPVTCAPDGTAYVYKTCVDDAARCGTRFCHFGHGERAPADPQPAGWPCP